MMRAFNAREGITRANDKLPAKMFKALTGTGPTAGVALDHAVDERGQAVLGLGDGRRLHLAIMARSMRAVKPSSTHDGSATR
jgi:hypothetical protein